jgi:hypothetical protein
MASGPRRHLEDFNRYRERLKKEHAQVKEKLKGRLVWFSGYLKYDETKMTMQKVLVQGTYRKE